MLASIFFSVVFGMQVSGMDDELVKAAEDTMELQNEYRVAGRFWVDLLPVLRYIPTWFPGAEFHQHAARTRLVSTQTRNQGFEFVKSGQVNLSA